MLNNSNRKSSELVRLCRGLTNQKVNGEGSKVNGEGFWLLRRHSEEGEARWWRKRKIGRPIGCRVSESPDSGIRHGVAGYFPPNFSLSLSVMPKASFCFHDWTGFNDAGGPLCNPCHNNVDKNRFDEISVRLFKPLRLFSIHLILVSHQAPSVPAIPPAPPFPELPVVEAPAPPPPPRKP